MLGSFTLFPQYLQLDLCAQLAFLRQRCQILQAENKRLKKMLEQAETGRSAPIQKSQFKHPPKKKERRASQDLDKRFSCPYPHCSKQYASDLAMNLHIRNKHNGGTKTEREILAKEIILAEERGDKLPDININFPPDYLKDFRKRFFNCQ